VNPEQALEDGPPLPLHWWPLIFSVFILLYPLALLKYPNATPFDWTLAALAVVLFFSLFALAVVEWQRQRPFLWIPVTLAMLGAALCQYHDGAYIFLLFAAALFPWAVNGNVQRCVSIAIVMVYAEAFISAIEPRALRWADVSLLTVGHIATGAWVVRMMLSIRRLGRVAIRERITRDLHEVLGNALSFITSKSEHVARRLVEPSSHSRAQEDIGAIESCSRKALSDVRQALRRYRTEVPEHAARTRINWWPMIFTVYIAFLPAGFWREGGASRFEWALIASGIVAFFALMAMAIVSWQRQRPFLGVFFRMTLLGVALAHLTPSAMILMMFAAAILPWAVKGDIWRTAWLTLFLLAVEFFVGLWVSPLREVWWIHVPVFTTVSAVGCLWAVRMSLRYLSLVKVAERERIARDLHDVLGHTLSVIALKSELARRLLADPRNIERVRNEMSDVERTSRDALADVRLTILGDRTETIDAEFVRATSTLRTAGISVECEREAVWLHSVHEGVLGLALREAVTNVVRHAEASRCHIRLQRIRNAYVLEVQDNGRGETGGEGLGLRGMRERIEALGGSVLREISAGTRLTVRLPVAPVPT
jgi:two-component system sensor histidine kinase DesK